MLYIQANFYPIYERMVYMEKKKKIITIGAVSAGAIALLVGSSLALFSDTDSASTKAKVGTLDIAISNLALTNDQNVNPGDNDPEVEPYETSPEPNPEDKDALPPAIKRISTTPHDLTYTVSNLGNKSAKTRQTIIITSVDKDGKLINPDVFAVFKDSNGDDIAQVDEQVVQKSYILSDGSELAATYNKDSAFEKIDGCTAVKYVFESDSFDGVNINGDDAEDEYGAVVKRDEETNSATKDYKLMFSMAKGAGNEYQAADITIEVMVEAMQFRNTVSSDWELLSSEKIKTTVSGIELDTVPSL